MPIERFQLKEDTGKIAICGLVEGSTFLPATVDWYCNGKRIYVSREHIQPGEFVIVLPANAANGGYLPGNYQVDIRIFRTELASTTFDIQTGARN